MLGLFTIILSVSLTSFLRAEASEGFFDPKSFSFPKTMNANQVIQATVKIKSKWNLNLNVFDSDSELEKWNDADPQISDDGTALMNLGFLRSQISRCTEPIFYNQPGQFEFCQTAKSGASWPQVVPLDGGATGSFISDDGYILTNFHVAMMCILKAGWENGAFHAKPAPCRNLSVEIFDGFTADGKIKYLTIDDVELVANSSMQETFPGNKLDVALLKVNYRPQYHFNFDVRPLGQFTKLFMLGHPIRSERNPEKLAAVGYSNADGSLRVSVGSYLYSNTSTNFLSDLDGGPGNSGSPTINANGSIVGLLSTSFGNPDMAPIAYSGFSPQHVLADAICKRLELGTRFPSVKGCH